MSNMNFQVTVKYTLKPISGHTGTAKSPLTIGLSGTMTILQNLALKHMSLGYGSETIIGLKDFCIGENTEY